MLKGHPIKRIILFMAAVLSAILITTTGYTFIVFRPGEEISMPFSAEIACMTLILLVAGLVVSVRDVLVFIPPDRKTGDRDRADAIRSGA
jgi:hypothetical protein